MLGKMGWVERDQVRGRRAERRQWLRVRPWRESPALGADGPTRRISQEMAVWRATTEAGWARLPGWVSAEAEPV